MIPSCYIHTPGELAEQFCIVLIIARLPFLCYANCTHFGRVNTSCLPAALIWITKIWKVKSGLLWLERALDRLSLCKCLTSCHSRADLDEAWIPCNEIQFSRLTDRGNLETWEFNSEILLFCFLLFFLLLVLVKHGLYLLKSFGF